MSVSRVLFCTYRVAPLALGIYGRWPCLVHVGYPGATVVLVPPLRDRGTYSQGGEYFWLLWAGWILRHIMLML